MNRLLFLLVITGALLGACGEHRDDPKKAYSDLVTAAHTGDGGAMYDMLDRRYRADFDTALARKSAMGEQMPADEKATWGALKGLKGRDAFAKMVSLNKDALTAPFKGDYEVLTVDTLVVLTVKHTDRPADLIYLRWEDGKYRYTAPPSPPVSMPAGHPNIQGGGTQMAPQTPPQHQAMPDSAGK